MPPYLATPMRRAYELTGFGNLPAGASDGAIYQHAMSFLDRLRQEAATRGLVLDDRLDTQSLVWAVLKWDPPESWTEAEREGLIKYRGGIIEPTGELKELAERLLLPEAFLQDARRLLAARGESAA